MKQVKIFTCIFLLVTLFTRIIYFVLPIPIIFISMAITLVLAILFSIVLSSYIMFRLEETKNNQKSLKSTQRRRASRPSTASNQPRDTTKTVRVRPISRTPRLSSSRADFWDEESLPSTNPPPRRSSRFPSFDNRDFNESTPSLIPPRRSSRFSSFDEEDFFDNEDPKEGAPLFIPPRRLSLGHQVSDEQDVLPSYVPVRPRPRSTRRSFSTNNNQPRPLVVRRILDNEMPTSASASREDPISEKIKIPIVGPGIFVSHSSKNDAFGIKLVEDIQNAIGANKYSWYNSEGAMQKGNPLWYDSQDGLQGGDNWWDKVMEELRARPIFIIILSPDAMNSGWVKDELNVAWQHKNSSLGKRIIPIVYKPCKTSDYLNTIQHISFENEQQYAASLQKLLRVLDYPTNA